MPSMPERVTALETDNNSTKEDIREIFRVLRATADTHAATARQQEITQAQLNQMSQTVGQHSDDIRRLNQAYWMSRGVLWLVGGAGMSIGATLLAVMKYLGGHP